MSLFLQIFCSVLLVSTSYSIDWPLVKCNKSDPNVGTCILHAARQSTQKLFNGIPQVHLPPLEPMVLGDMVLTARKGPVNLEVEFKSAVLTGPSNIRIDSARYDTKRHRIDLEVYHKEILLRAKYVMKGRLFLIPVNSEGIVEMRFQNLLAGHYVQFIPTRKENLDVSPIQKSKIDLILDMKILDKMHINLTANGLGSIGNRALNDLLNSNWRLLYNAFKSSIEKWLQDVYTKSIAPLFSMFNFDEMFSK